MTKHSITASFWPPAAVGAVQLLAGGVVRALDPRGEVFGFEPVWVQALTATWIGAALLLGAAVIGVVSVVRAAPSPGDPVLLRWSRGIRVLVLVLSAAGFGFVLALGWDELVGHLFRAPAPWAGGAIGVLAGCGVAVCLLCWIVRSIGEKTRRHPSNIDEVPEPFRTYAKTRGPVWSGVRDALHGGLIGALLAIGWALRPGAAGQLGVVLGAVIAALVLAFLALAAWDVDRKEAAAGEAVRDRIERVREHGDRIRAEVVSVDAFGWGAPYAGVDAVRFEVTARLGAAGAELCAGEILVDVADAPVVGGTVLVWRLGDDPDDRYMEPDPDSIRDPDARAGYRRPMQ